MLRKALKTGLVGFWEQIYRRRKQVALWQRSLTWDATCWQSRACNTKVNSAMWSSFQPVKYFIPILLICKFHKDWTKITQAMLWTKSNGTQGQVTPKWIVRVEIPTCRRILCLSRLSASLIKIRTRQNMGFFGTKGKVTPKSIVQSGRNSTHPRFYACPDYHSASLIKIWLKLNRLCSRQGQICCILALKGK